MIWLPRRSTSSAPPLPVTSRPPRDPPSMHYCFLTTGSWEGNASFVRLREFGTQMVARGLRVSYVVDDVPYNRSNDNLKLDPRAEVRFTQHPRSIKQLSSRRRILRNL